MIVIPTVKVAIHQTRAGYWFASTTACGPYTAFGASRADALEQLRQKILAEHPWPDVQLLPI